MPQIDFFSYFSIFTFFFILLLILYYFFSNISSEKIILTTTLKYPYNNEVNFTEIIKWSDTFANNCSPITFMYQDIVDLNIIYSNAVGYVWLDISVGSDLELLEIHTDFKVLFYMI